MTVRLKPNSLLLFRSYVVSDTLGDSVEFIERSTIEKSPVVGLEGFGIYPFSDSLWI